LAGKAAGLSPELLNRGYRGNTGRNYGGQALPALIMGLKPAWNHDVFFDYTDRYIAWVRSEGGTDFQGHFIEDMWDAYRSDYGCVWKEEGEGPYYDCSACLYDCLTESYCGDGSCDAGETGTCAYDCGSCITIGSLLDYITPMETRQPNNAWLNGKNRAVENRNRLLKRKVFK